MRIFGAGIDALPPIGLHQLSREGSARPGTRSGDRSSGEPSDARFVAVAVAVAVVALALAVVVVVVVVAAVFVDYWYLVSITVFF